MIKFIIIFFVALVIAVVGMSFYLSAKSNKNVEKFLLPEGSDKEYFEDPKTGKKYDKAAYTANLQAYVKTLNNQQLQGVYSARNGRTDIWNTLLADAAHEELLRRANTPRGEEDADGLAEDINEDIEPFFWVEQSIGASIGLTTGEYLQDLFDSHGMEGNGRDWDRIAKVFLNEYPKMRGVVQFDSQNDMFCAYARDEQVLKQFAYKFHACCEDEEAVKALFDRVSK